MGWEYKTIKFEATGFRGGKVDEAEVDRTLIALGEQGWEVAAAFNTNGAQGWSRYYVYTLKRPTPDHDPARDA